MKHVIQSNDPRQVEGQKIGPDAHIVWWVSMVVIFGALLTTTGAVESQGGDPAFLTNGSAMTAAARVYADYLFAQNRCRWP